MFLIEFAGLIATETRIIRNIGKKMKNTLSRGLPAIIKKVSTVCADVVRRSDTEQRRAALNLSVSQLYSSATVSRFYLTTFVFIRHSHRDEDPRTSSACAPVIETGILTATSAFL